MQTLKNILFPLAMVACLGGMLYIAGLSDKHTAVEAVTCSPDEVYVHLQRLENECLSHEGARWIWLISDDDLRAVGRCTPFWEELDVEEIESPYEESL